jgi:citrate lyase subunit beta/citryl-CoA lyase
MHDEEMIHEASRTMALAITGKGRAAGIQRTSSFTPPTEADSADRGAR